MDQHSADLTAPQGAPALTGGTARPSAPKRSFASFWFGYDIFLSFGLGPPPRGTHSYASDLARRLRERDFSVFFSEDEAPPGEQLDSTLRKALLSSKILVVIANRGTLQEPRWVRDEVEEYRKERPDRPVIPVNVDGALQDVTLAESAQEWLGYQGKIWLDESEEAVSTGIASREVVERLSMAPVWRKSNVRWRWIRNGAIAALAALAIGLGITAKIARDNEREAIHQRQVAEEQARVAFSRQLAAEATNLLHGRLDTALLLSVESLNVKETVEAQKVMVASLIQSPHLITFLSVDGDSSSLVAFSPDGKILASGGGESALIHLWDITDPRAAKPLGTPLEGGDLSLAFSPDGKILAALGVDAVTLWDVTDPHAAEPLGTPLEGGFSLAFSPDGKILATGSSHGTITLWDFSDPQSAKPLGSPLKGHHDYITAVAFSPDGKTLASIGGYKDKTILLWDVTNPRFAKQLGNPLPGHDGGAHHLAYMPKNKILATGGYDGKIILWDISEPRKPKPLGAPLKGLGGLTSLTFSPDGKLMAATGEKTEKGKILLWDVSNPRAAKPLGISLEGHDAGREKIAFSPDGRILASAGGTLILWNVSDLRSVKPLGVAIEGYRGPARDVAFGTDGKKQKSEIPDDMDKKFITDGSAWMSAKPISALNRLKNEYALAFSPDGKTLASSDLDKRVVLWDVTDPWKAKLRKTLDGLKASAGGLAFSPDGKILATAGGGASWEIHLWDIAAPGSARLLGLPFDKLGSVFAFSPNSKRLALAESRSGKITLWDISDPRTRQLLGQPIDSRYCSHLAFSPDGRLLASSEGSHGIVLRDITDPQSAKPLGKPLVGHEIGASRFTFSRNGKILASEYPYQGGIILWDISDPAQAKPLGKHEGQWMGIAGMAFSSDDKTLASVTQNGKIILWDVSDPTAIKVLYTLEGHKAAVLDVAFSPDGKTLASLAEDDRIMLWDLDVKSWPARACRRANRNLSKEEWDKYMGGFYRQYRITCEGLPEGE